MTVVQPGPVTLPTGLGIGPTHVGWEDMSFRRAAGSPPIITVAEPLLIMPGPAGTHDGNMQVAVVSVTRAAGLPPISTVASPFTIANGNAG